MITYPSNSFKVDSISVSLNERVPFSSSEEGKLAFSYAGGVLSEEAGLFAATLTKINSLADVASETVIGLANDFNLPKDNENKEV